MLTVCYGQTETGWRCWRRRMHWSADQVGAYSEQRWEALLCLLISQVTQSWSITTSLYLAVFVLLIKTGNPNQQAFCLTKVWFPDLPTPRLPSCPTIADGEQGAHEHQHEQLDSLPNTTTRVLACLCSLQSANAARTLHELEKLAE